MSGSVTSRLSALLATASVVVALLVAGCGGTNSHSSAANAPSGSTAGATTAGSAPTASPKKGSTAGIPQGNGGDQDADNNGGPSDGDGNL
jgi:hypothetical protein